MPILECIGVVKKFGGLYALKGVDLEIKEKEILGLIGPNGAGKTTLFNCISGVMKPDGGEIKFKGRLINKMKPHQICKLGIGRTYQIPQPFWDLSTLKNVMVGALFGRKEKIGMDEAEKIANEVLEFIGLEKKKDVPAKSLNISELKILEVARALATDPELMLIDEMIAGLNPTEADQATELIKKVRDDLGITVLWVEHVMKAVMRTCERIVVLDYGEKIAEGTPQEVASNPRVIEAYLGTKGGVLR